VPTEVGHIIIIVILSMQKCNIWTFHHYHCHHGYIIDIKRGTLNKQSEETYVKFTIRHELASTAGHKL
jgi:hypothetical protein